MAATSARIPDIQVLRGIAVLAVVLHHILSGNLFPGRHPDFEQALNFIRGDAGVDLFFVISGYVIARTLLPAMKGEDDWARMLSFWQRRIWRLWPAAWGWVLLMCLGAAFYNRSGAWGSLHAAGASGLAAILQVADFRFAHCFMHSECGSAAHYWSLSLEEQFYLILPLLLWILPVRWRLATLLGLIIGQLGWHLLYSLAFFRSLGLVCGVTLALLDARWRLQARLQAYPRTLLLGLVVLLQPLFWLLSSPWWGLPWPSRYDLQALSAMLMLALVLGLHDGLVNLPGGALMHWVGNRSYSLYLSHFAAFWCLRETFFRFCPHSAALHPGLYLLALPLMLLMAHLSWLFFERWPLRWRQARAAPLISTEEVLS